LSVAGGDGDLECDLLVEYDEKEAEDAFDEERLRLFAASLASGLSIFNS